MPLSGRVRGGCGCRCLPRAGNPVRRAVPQRGCFSWRLLQGGIEAADEPFEPFGVGEAQLLSALQFLCGAADLLQGGIHLVGG